MSDNRLPVLSWIKDCPDLLKFRPKEYSELNIQAVMNFFQSEAFFRNTGYFYSSINDPGRFLCHLPDFLSEIRQILSVKEWQKDIGISPESANETTYLYDNGCLQIRTNKYNRITWINFVSQNSNIHEALLTYTRSKLIDIQHQGSVYVLTMGQSGPKLTRAGNAGLELERDNYTDAVLNDFDHIAIDLTSQSPCGKVVILEGEPGGGKTFFIRAITKAVQEATFIIVQPSMVSGLARPELIQALISKKQENSDSPMILIIED